MRRLVKKYSSLSGLMSSSKNSHSVWFESMLELDFALTLEFNPNVTHYIEQPCVIEYETDKTRTYTPDFLVFYKNESPCLCEVKPKDKLLKNTSQYKFKFEAAMDFAIREGWKFKVLTEEHIRTTYLENIKFLNKYDSQYTDKHCNETVYERVKVMGITTIGELFKSFDGTNNDLQAKLVYSLWSLVKHSEIGSDLNEKLSLNSEIWINEK